jgi:peptide/nickel transport system substrate-binding protein
MQIALMIQQNLAAVGIQTEIVTYDFATVLSNMRALDFQLCFMGSAASIEPSGSTSGILYFTQTDDEHLNDLIAQGTATVVTEERKAIYDEIQEYCLEMGYLSNLYSKYNVVVYNNRLSNIPVTTTDFFANKLSWTWEVN